MKELTIDLTSLTPEKIGELKKHNPTLKILVEDDESENILKEIETVNYGNFNFGDKILNENYLKVFVKKYVEQRNLNDDFIIKSSSNIDKFYSNKNQEAITDKVVKILDNSNISSLTDDSEEKQELIKLLSNHFNLEEDKIKL
jgi:hypothetical protein